MKLWCVFDLAKKKEQINALEAESMVEDFWADNRKAQAQMQQLNALREEISTWENIDEQLNDLHGLAELLEEEPDEGMQEEVAQSLAAIEQQVEKLQSAGTSQATPEAPEYDGQCLRPHDTSSPRIGREHN